MSRALSPHNERPEIDVAVATLDAAEQAFSELGYGGASLRAIARAAGVNQAMVNYYFTTKEGLFSAVIGRRSELINEQRRELLAQAKAAGDLTMERLITVLVSPAIQLSADPSQAGHVYMKLVGQLINSTDEMSRRVLSANFDEIAQLFIPEIERLEPRLGVNAAVRGYVYTIAITMASVGSEWRMDILSDTHDGQKDIEGIIAATVAFSVAGIRALANDCRSV